MAIIFIIWPKVSGPRRLFVLVGQVSVVGGTGRKGDTERRDNGGQNSHLGLLLHSYVLDIHSLGSLAALG